jgi:hypothetical protein
MAILSSYTTVDLKHWELHLNAALKENPKLETEIQSYLTSKTQLPNLKVPYLIHDWLEIPEKRTWLESY